MEVSCVPGVSHGPSEPPQFQEKLQQTNYLQTLRATHPAVSSEPPLPTWGSSATCTTSTCGRASCNGGQPPELSAGHELSASSTAAPIAPLEAEVSGRKPWRPRSGPATTTTLTGSGFQAVKGRCGVTLFDDEPWTSTADDEFTGNERPRELSQALPQGVKNIETTQFYRPRPGHPDPGVPVYEDRRLFDHGLKRGHDG